MSKTNVRISSNIRISLLFINMKKKEKQRYI